MSKTVMTYNNTVMSFGATPKWMAIESQDTAYLYMNDSMSTSQGDSWNNGEYSTDKRQLNY